MEKDSIEHQPAERRKNIVYRLLTNPPLLVLLLLIAVIVILQTWIRSEGRTIEAQKASAQAKAQPPTNVVVLELKPGTIQDRINLPGVVHPWVTLKMSAEVRGKIIEKKVQEGSFVSKGTVIAMIDDRDYRNAHASAGASYQAARSSLDRISQLFQDQLATRSQLDDATALMETSKAAMDNAALEMDRCAIRVNMDGVVDKLPIEIGQFLNVGDPVAQILQIDRVKIEVGIPETDVDAVRRIENFQIVIDALKGEIFEGRLHYLGRSADGLARSYPLEIAVDNSDSRLLPDMFARVDVVKQKVENSLSVPLFSLITVKKEQTVFLADAGQVRQVRVQTGIQEGWRVQILDGLSAGDKVVVVGQRDMKDGAAVNVVRTVSDPEELNQ